MPPWPECLRPSSDLPSSYHETFRTFLTIDWRSKIGLGLDEWPIYLQLGMRYLFASQLPSVILFGDHLIHIYNEPYKRALGSGGRPDLMGRAWSEVYSPSNQTVTLQKIHDVIKSGQSKFGTGVQHFVTGHAGHLEEVFYDYNIVPFWDVDGSIKGVMMSLSDQTDAIMTRRREQAIAQLQNDNLNIRAEKDLFKAIEKVADDYWHDFPCLMGYHCNEALNYTGDRSYSPVVLSGVQKEALPKVITHAEAIVTSLPSYAARRLEDYMMEVLRTGTAITLEDPRIISQFCIRRAFGELTRIVILTPIFALAMEQPAGISIQGINPRRPANDLVIVSQFSQCLLTSIETMHKRMEHDATEEKQRAELADALARKTQQLRASQKKFEIMAETCPSGMFIFNLNEGQFEFVNEAYYDITGIPRTEDVDTWQSWVHPDHHERALDAWKNITQDAPINNLEVRWLVPWRDDKERWTTSSSIVIDDGAGNSYIFGSFQDISAAKYSLQMERERADGAVRMKQQQLEFIDMIAHELRNPLGAIMQSSDFLIEKLGVPSKHSHHARLVTSDDVEDLGTIVLCAQHMSRIINDTLNLSKLEGGLLVATYVPTQPLEVARGVLAMFEAEARRNNITMQLELEQSWHEHGINWVQTDPSRLTQIMINLIANSLKFVSKMEVRRVKLTLAASKEPLQTQVTVNRRPSLVTLQHRSSYNMSSPSFEAEPYYIICRITDTGPGMSEEQVASLFQRYFQASPKTHVEYGGSGLGLFISKQLVTLLNGEISVESEKDIGTTFAFSIKTISADAEGRKASLSELSDTDLANDDQSPQTVLIAEDNLINQKIFVKQLKQAGYRTQVANNGQEVIDIILEDQKSDNAIAMCLCDAEMPVLGGIDAVRKIRRLEDDDLLERRIPFIAVTANARQEQVMEMIEAGMDDCVAKPFRLPALVSKMNDVMSRMHLKPLVQRKPVMPQVGRSRGSLENLSKTQPEGNLTVTEFRHESIASFWLSDDKECNIIMLNSVQTGHARTIWGKASGLRICADGATDRLHSEVFQLTLDSMSSKDYPDVIIGDLDSITNRTLEFYENQKDVILIRDRDQNSTDFTKAVRYCATNSPMKTIVAIGGLTGRLDQTLSTLHTLFLNPHVMLVDGQNAVIMLEPGLHHIDTSHLGPHCGLMPMNGAVKCSTTGLQWCLQEETMEIGHLISTNNLIVAADDMVTVCCDGKVLFCIECS